MKYLYTAALLCCFSLAMQAQGLIINEVTNGTAGAKEYVELLVIGGAGVEFAPVDLRGWIIDDNNGSFQGSTGAGVAAGHFRIAPGCAALSAVPVGSIILLYNADDKDPTPADDPTDANNDRVYIFPHTHACIEVCTSTPSSSPASTTYSGCAYQSTTTLAVSSPRSWTAISLGNGADAMQTRKPDFSFYHGFAYGTVSATFPSFPAELGGGSSFNVATGSGAARSFNLGCGAWNVASNYGFVAASVQTPAATNNANNAILVNNIRTGNYIYSNPSDPNNCILTLPIKLLSFEATAANGYNLLDFAIETDEDGAQIYIEKSSNGLDFSPIASFSPMEKQLIYSDSYLDLQPLPLTYYRLKTVEANGKQEYSSVKVVRQQPLQGAFALYPNPAQQQISLEFAQPIAEEAKVEIYNHLGQLVYQQLIQQGARFIQIELAQLSPAAYELRVQGATSQYSSRFIKQ